MARLDVCTRSLLVSVAIPVWLLRQGCRSHPGRGSPFGVVNLELFVMSLMYRMLLRRSGLSKNDAAKLHEVPVEQVKDWMRYTSYVPLAELYRIDDYCREAAAPKSKR